MGWRKRIGWSCVGRDMVGLEEVGEESKYVYEK